MPKRAGFVVIEGGDGSGKGSLVKLAQRAFPRAHFTREPGGSPSAEVIRELMLSDATKDLNGLVHFGFVLSARRVHLTETVYPKLAQGHPVVSDRMEPSTLAYQVYGQERLDLEEDFWRTRDFLFSHGEPDHYIFLDVDPQEGLRRRAEARGANHFDVRGLDFHQRVRAGYLRFFGHKGVKCTRINANAPFDDVMNAGLNALSQLIK